jgi:hypothetical protein
MGVERINIKPKVTNLNIENLIFINTVRKKWAITFDLS